MFHLAQRFAGNASADILITHTGIREAARFARDPECRSRQLLHHRVFDVFKQLGDRFRLVMMRIGVDDEDILEPPFIALTRGVCQQFRRVELIDFERIDVVT